MKIISSSIPSLLWFFFRVTGNYISWGVCVIYLYLVLCVLSSLLFRERNAALPGAMVFLTIYLNPLTHSCVLQKCLLILCLLPAWLWPPFTVGDLQTMWLDRYRLCRSVLLDISVVHHSQWGPKKAVETSASESVSKWAGIVWKTKQIQVDFQMRKEKG